MTKNVIEINSLVTTSVFVVTFIFVGIPLWWKTTEVYRYPIPHTDCQNLLSATIRHVIFTKIVLGDLDVQQGLFWEELLKLSKEEQQENKQPIIQFSFLMSLASETEEKIIKEIRNISELDNAFEVYKNKEKAAHKNSVGELIIVVLNKSYSKGPKFVIGNNRRGYLLNEGDSKSLAQDVISLAKKIAQVDRLQKLYTSASLYSGDKRVHSYIPQSIAKLWAMLQKEDRCQSYEVSTYAEQPDKDRMRYLRTSKSFDITFSLIIPEPQVVEVNWNIQQAIEEYLKGVLEQLNMISSVRVKSQIIYMTSLPIPTQLSLNDKKEFILESQYLPSLINPIEDKLGSDTSVQPNLNFVLYIPTRHQTPLRIYDSKGHSLPSNAFLLPQWGGFMIYNCDLPENATLPHVVNLNMRNVMEVFLSQFRLLLGLPEVDSLSNESCVELKGPIIRKWEMDFLMRKNTQDQLSSSMSSLSSLSHLLQTIKSIVIRDDIGEKIHFALSSTQDSLKYLSQGNLEKGLRKAQDAFSASEEAFFDPSLLALLYFPEDQKYAIYVPLFLPISIPVIASTSQLWMYWKNRKQKLKPD